jgi:hypothetical protein
MAEVFHLDAGVGFAVILDDIARRSEMLWEMRVMHGISE